MKLDQVMKNWDRYRYPDFKRKIICSRESWDNWGIYLEDEVWHILHLRPCEAHADFVYAKSVDKKYTLTAEDNFSDDWKGQLALELSRCPFCRHGEANIFKGFSYEGCSNGGFIILCSNCGGSLCGNKLIPELANRWNKRESPHCECCDFYRYDDD